MPANVVSQSGIFGISFADERAPHSSNLRHHGQCHRGQLIPSAQASRFACDAFNGVISGVIGPEPKRI
jgi:hypothetical protein